MQNYYAVVVWNKNSHVPSDSWRLETEQEAREFFQKRIATGLYRKAIIEHQCRAIVTFGS